MLQQISSSAIHVISNWGYLGIVFLMAIESAAVPLPSEVIMPFAGYLAATGRFTLLGISLAGALGSAIGSTVLYWIGYLGGRPLIEKYGKFILISHKDLDRADKFFAKYGELSNFIGRMLPVVRTYISFPAGVSRIEVKKFVINSFIGSFFWSLLLGYIGYKLGQNWESLKGTLHKFDYAIVALILAGLAYYIYKHFQKARD